MLEGMPHSTSGCSVPSASLLAPASSTTIFAAIGVVFGAFVWSVSPGPKPSNNYGEGNAP